MTAAQWPCEDSEGGSRIGRDTSEMPQLSRRGCCKLPVARCTCVGGVHTSHLTGYPSETRSAVPSPRFRSTKRRLGGALGVVLCGLLALVLVVTIVRIDAVSGPCSPGRMRRRRQPCWWGPTIGPSRERGHPAGSRARRHSSIWRVPRPIWRWHVNWKQGFVTKAGPSRCRLTRMAMSCSPPTLAGPLPSSMAASLRWCLNSALKEPVDQP